MKLSDYQNWSKGVNCFKAFPTVGELHFTLGCAFDPITAKKFRAQYGAVGLASECGEVTSVIHKDLRGGDKPKVEALAEELGDVITWACFIANTYDIDLEEVLSGAHAKMINKYKLDEEANG